MSRLLDFIKTVKQSGDVVSVNVPGAGFVDAKITAIDDDMVTVVPDTGRKKFVIHYTQFCMGARK